MTDYVQPLLVVCALACGFATAWFLDDGCTQPDVQTEIDTETGGIKWKTRYKRLLKTKRVFIPVPVYNVTDCEAELETCTRALSAIKLWCDPTCKQELSECLRILQGCSSRPYWQERY